MINNLEVSFRTFPTSAQSSCLIQRSTNLLYTPCLRLTADLRPGDDQMKRYKWVTAFFAARAWCFARQCATTGLLLVAQSAVEFCARVVWKWPLRVILWLGLGRVSELQIGGHFWAWSVCWVHYTLTFLRAYKNTDIMDLDQAEKGRYCPPKSESYEMKYFC